MNIAEEMKLSRNTVSKALNDDNDVSDQTKERIIRTALKMGYKKLKPDIAVKYGEAPAPQKVKTILVLILSDASLFWTKIIEGVNGLLQSEGYYVSYYFIAAEEDFDVSARIPSTMDVAGLIVLSVFSDDFMRPFINMGVPSVYLDIAPSRDYGGVSGDIVLCEGVDAVSEITQGLINQGLRRIGFIGDTFYSRSIKDRFDGYMHALHANGVEPDRSIIFNGHVPYRYYNMREIEEAIASIRDIPDAMVCANDSIAMFLISILAAKGLSVPGDMAVTGYDNLEALNGGAPRLTTVLVEHEKLGQRIARQLLWRINNPSFPPEVIIVRGKAVKRESSNKAT